MQFRPLATQAYGLDYFRYRPNVKQFNDIEFSDGTYYVPVKSLGENSTDRAKVILPPGKKPHGTTLASGEAAVYFLDQDKNECLISDVNTNKDGYTTATITIPATAKRVKAVEKRLVDSLTVDILLGRLDVETYTPATRIVLLVPVNGKTLPVTTQTVEDSLNRFYRQAAMTWDVSLRTNGVNISGWDTHLLDDGDNAMMSKYTTDMQALIQAYKDSYGDPGADTSLLFICGSPASGSKQGYMPIKGRFGFLFADKLTAANAPRTAAHELGHGAFRLWHTFSTQNKYLFAQGTTPNLMDYNNDSTELFKYQWDYVHDPETITFAWTQDEAEGASSLISLTDFSFYGENNTYDITNDIDGVAFTTPHYSGKSKGKPIAFLKNTKLGFTATLSFKSTIDENQSLNLRIKATDFLDNKTIKTFVVPSKNITITKQDNNSTITITKTETDFVFPNKPFYLEDYRISFEIVITNKDENLDNVANERWLNVGKTLNDIYVIFEKPNIGDAGLPEDRKLFESLLFITCKNANVQNATTSNEIISAIWGIFNNNDVSNNQNLVRKDGKKLKYYSPHNTGIFSVADLLAKNPPKGFPSGDGQCGSFAKLFLNMLLAQGVSVDIMKYVQYGVHKDMSLQTCPMGFLVKNWSFAASGSPVEKEGISYTHTNKVPLPDNWFTSFAVSEVTDITGVSGQNSSNPASLFNNHQIVVVNNVFYDPSYGISYSKEENIKNSIQAIFYSELQEYDYNGLNGKYYFYYIKKYEPKTDPFEIVIFPYKPD